MERIPQGLRCLTGGYTPLRFASVGMTVPFEDVAHVDTREGCPYDGAKQTFSNSNLSISLRTRRAAALFTAHPNKSEFVEELASPQYPFSRGEGGRANARSEEEFGRRTAIRYKLRTFSCVQP